jgi:hypothetical protein
LNQYKLVAFIGCEEILRIFVGGFGVLWAGGDDGFGVRNLPKV